MLARLNSGSTSVRCARRQSYVQVVLYRATKKSLVDVVASVSVSEGRRPFV